MTRIKEAAVKTAIIYTKDEGKIVRAVSLTKAVLERITESDLEFLLPGFDTTDLAMVFVEGKQFFNIEKYKVDLDQHGRFKEIVEREEDILGTLGGSEDIAAELLDREISVVISVLDILTDKNRLAKYKIMEQQGRNRIELLNYFKQRGV